MIHPKKYDNVEQKKTRIPQGKGTPVRKIKKRVKQNSAMWALPHAIELPPTPPEVEKDVYEGFPCASSPRDHNDNTPWFEAMRRACTLTIQKYLRKRGYLCIKGTQYGVAHLVYPMEETNNVNPFTHSPFALEWSCLLTFPSLAFTE